MIPMTFDHYVIRLITLEDLARYFDLIENNRKRLEDFFAGTVAITKTINDTEIHLRDVIQKAEKNNYFPFVVIDLNSNKLIASIQVKSVDWTVAKAELGYYIDRDYEGKGIIKKAVSMIIDHCFDQVGLAKLYIRTHEGNKPSVTIAEANGFQIEGKIRRDYKTTSGVLIDVLYFGLLKEEWKKNIIERQES